MNEPYLASSRTSPLSRLGGRSLAVIGILLIVVIAVMAWSFAPIRLGQESGAPLPPMTLYLEAQGWHAPSGETVSGIISYQPSTKAVAYVKGPQLDDVGIARSPISSPFDSNFMNALGMRASSTGVSLVRVSLPAQTVTHTYSTRPPGSSFFSPILSSDGSEAAYTYASPDPKAVGGGAYVAHDAGTASYVGIGLPIAFSPDGTKVLLAAGSSELRMVSVANLASTTVSGATMKDVEQVSVAQDGSLLMARGVSGTVTIFSIDWQNAKLTPRASLPAFPANAADAQAIVAGNDVLLTYTAGKVTAYRIGASSLQKAGQFSLPAGAHMLGASFPH